MAGRRRHPLEVTSERLLLAYERYYDCLDSSDLDAIGKVREAFDRLIEADSEPVPVLAPGDSIPPEQTGGMTGFVAGKCGHRVAASEWKAGFRTCERCQSYA